MRLQVSGIGPASNVMSPHISSPKPKAKAWGHRLESRQPSKLKAAAATLKTSRLISLGTGRPNPEYFPWDSLVAHGRRHRPDGTFGTETTPAACNSRDEPFGLSSALNYGDAVGSAPLVRFVTEHVEMVHKPRYEDWQTCLTCGTTSALDIILRMFCKPGDSVLFEELTYPPTIEIAHAQRLNPVGVGMDSSGLEPAALDRILCDWDAARGPKPFVLYMIPSGHNPTGSTQSHDRRKAIYEVAERHDLFIIEDDPYFYLQLGSSPDDDDDDDTNRRKTRPSFEEYLDNLPASYLSLDTSGRVARLDSTSKTLAPGLRVGWLTASGEVVRRFLADTEISTTSPAGPSQVMMHKLLVEAWGHGGFVDWLGHLSLQYGRRRDVLVEACRRGGGGGLPESVCSWTVPTFGMFLLVRVDVADGHPAASDDVAALDVEDRIYRRVLGNGVLVTKGSWFAAEPGGARGVAFRLTFAAAPEEELGRAVEAFGRAVREEFGIV